MVEPYTHYLPLLLAIWLPFCLENSVLNNWVLHWFFLCFELWMLWTIESVKGVLIRFFSSQVDSNAVSSSKEGAAFLAPLLKTVPDGKPEKLTNQARGWKGGGKESHPLGWDKSVRFDETFKLSTKKSSANVIPEIIKVWVTLYWTFIANWFEKNVFPPHSPVYTLSKKFKFWHYMHPFFTFEKFVLWHHMHPFPLNFLNRASFVSS